MTSVDEIIEQAKKEDRTIHQIRRDARNELKRVIKEGPSLSLKQAYRKAVEINEPLRQDGSNGTTILSVHVPDLFRDLADALVLAGVFPSRGEIFRTAIREYLKGWIDLTEFEGR